MCIGFAGKTMDHPPKNASFPTLDISRFSRLLPQPECLTPGSAKLTPASSLALRTLKWPIIMKENKTIFLKNLFH